MYNHEFLLILLECARKNGGKYSDEELIKICYQLYEYEKAYKNWMVTKNQMFKKEVKMVI